MKVKLIVNCEGPNPAYKRGEPAGPDNPRSITRPIGTEIDGPESWILCLPDAGGNVRAEPVDAEAKKRVAAAQAARQQQLDGMNAKQRASREKLAGKLPSLQDDGSNGPSPDAQKAAAKKTRRRKAGQ